MNKTKAAIKNITAAIVISNIIGVFVLNHSIASIIISDIFCVGCCVFHQFIKTAVNNDKEEK